MPFVVPQLKTITLGGAVTGLGIESSSFRSGLPHESVLEMEVLVGDGRICGGEASWTVTSFPTASCSARATSSQRCTTPASSFATTRTSASTTRAR